ncbi:threonylcarbamoyl-AMP synthase [Hydrogenophilus thermoluteolus]|uniref:L-threonylcarbamoyladenylate synthase n=1 Tax=Hydrogenophilus thermoluteolus TaxID=297 RepID=UPI0024A41389|nr:L-threonylcarbamoyladenylate synthase [Hydrogenophilus thermoluteolus]GLW60159.1 threonylcarbamoyl-AMP synthase [Hydrogenophilus thermoluteolus]
MVHPDRPTLIPATADRVDAVASRLASGALVALPTETVYGLAADAENRAAVRAVFVTKGRPADHPLIVHLASAAMAARYAAVWPRAAAVLADRFWPGPLTLVVPAQATVLREVTGGQPTVALRVPQQPFTLAVIEKLGRGVVAPSANRFGRISPTTARHVAEEFPTHDLWIADAGPTPVGVESTIVDVSRIDSVGAVVLRPGAVSASDIAQTLQTAGISSTVCAPVLETAEAAVVGSGRADDPRVPGALPSHYAPTTPLRLWQREAYHRFVETAAAAPAVTHAVWFPPNWPSTPGEVLRLPQPEADAAIAQQLYDTLRTLDASGAQELWVALPEGDSPLLTAVRDRLRRAASR